MMRRGITISCPGIGDALQFSSLPENYFRATGERLIDVGRHWIFDYNPYVLREETPDDVTELWNFGPKKYEWPVPVEAPEVYRSNAEIWASFFGVPVVLNRPRLYAYEDFPYENRIDILLQTRGRSHGELPEHVIQHVINKYGPNSVLHIGNDEPRDFGLMKIQTPTLWDLVREIASCRMLIGPDSGPAWIAACYPDVVVKKVRLARVHGEKELKHWVPLERANFHSHWDDRVFQVYNASEDDVGFTQSYKKL